LVACRSSRVAREIAINNRIEGIGIESMHQMSTSCLAANIGDFVIQTTPAY